MKNHAHGADGLVFGSELDRRLVDLALSVNDAVLWSFRFTDGQVTWTPGLDELLRISGAGEDDVRARLLGLIAPLTVAARTVPAWRDLELEQPIDTSSGQTLVIAFRARRFGDGRTGGLVGVATDATQSHKEHQELADVADRYRLLVELSPDAVWVHQDGIVRYVNPATVRMVGATSDSDIVGRSITEFVTESEVPALKARIASLTTPGATTVPTEVELLRADGETVLVESIAVRTTWEGRVANQVLVRDVTAQKAAAQTLAYQASHDELTDLLNHKGIRDLLSDLSRDDSKQLAVLLCDIDNFKRINDALGHQAGDEVLVALARRLRDGLPEGCTAARLSGDDFLIICPDVAAMNGLAVFAEWAAEFLHTVLPVRNQLISLSASVGAAAIDASMTSDDLLRCADMAMHHAKRLGPGRIVLADKVVATSMRGRLRLEEELRDAIGRDQLTLHYQPMVDHDGRVQMAEALVRWPHPQRGVISPGELLPVAEQGNLLGALDRWVLRTALHEAAAWPEPDGRPVGISVNLTRLLPDDPGFVDVITTIIVDSGIDRHRVVLEVVETALLDLSTRSRQAMIELTEQGVRFAVDDFGTGYSSLARLKDLPAQVIKLDTALVSDVETNQADLAIARALTDLARGLGRTCIAEGIETDGQRRILDRLGIDLYQGFLFFRPLPAAEFRAILDTPHHTPQAGQRPRTEPPNTVAPDQGATGPIHDRFPADTPGGAPAGWAQ